jgi:hypothetical protein
MTDYLAADVKVKEGAPQLATVASSPTAVVGMVAVTMKGPFGATLTTSWPEWESLYGGYVANGDGAKAAKGFFENGGRFLWTVRTVHYTSVLDPNSKISAAAAIALQTSGAATQGSVTSGNAEPFELAAGDTVVVKVDAGGNETATFDAVAAARTGSGGTYATGFVGGETLLLSTDAGTIQTITFTSAAQTLAQVITEINPQLAGGYADDSGGELRITSDRKGTGSNVNVTGGTGAATLGMGVGATAGTGDVSNIAAVTAAEAKTIIEADTTAQVTVESGGEIAIKTPTVGAGGSIQVDASSTADDAAKFDLDNSVHSGSAAGAGDTATATAKYHGAYGDGLQVVIGNANSGISDEFKWQTVENGVTVEAFDNLTTVIGAPRNWETILNATAGGSQYVDLVDLLAGTPPTNRPDNGTYSLTGGSDGLTGLADTDFVGDAAGPTGMYELDIVEDLTLLIIPGRATSYVHQEMVTYSETHRKRQVFPILDPPANYSATQIRDYVLTTASLHELSEQGAIYWPRVKVKNPDESIFTSDENGLIVVPPSGHIAGAYARTDGEYNVHQPPAGIERGILSGVLDFENREVLDQVKRDIVYPANINPITTWSGAPIHMDGNRTLKTSGNWGYISERRGMSYISRQIKLLLAFTRHSNNDRTLRRRCHRTLDVFLTGQTELGAFRYSDPDQAFTIDFSDALNPESLVIQHKLRGRVGVRKAKSVDWTTIEIFEDLALLDAELG